MIVDLTENVRIQIARRNELERIRDNQQIIADTAQALSSVRDALVPYITSLNLVRSCLTEEQIEEGVKKIETINTRLKRSHEKFAAQERPVRELNSLKGLVEELQDFLKQAWASYAYTKTQLQFELFNLVGQLPEVAEHMATIAPIKRNLETAPNKLPRTASDLEKFESELEALQDSLGNIEGLNSEITQFLYKVQNKTATVADLTDDVLPWCRENSEREAAFLITLGRSR
jgi:chromosome segregation ATPase